jgi:VanZ family protein
MLRLAPKFIVAVWLVYWACLFISTHIPIPRSAPQIRHGDKVAHFAAYFGLTILGAWRLSSKKQLSIKMLAAWAGLYCLYGLADEFLQPFVGRSLSIWDWLADVLGVALATLAVSWFWRAELSERGGERGSAVRPM